MNSVPLIRIQKVNRQKIDPKADFILYWMTAYRRPHWNYALQRAVGWALELKKPLLILEALRVNYQWASDRIHSFILKGMLDNQTYFKKYGVCYYPYIEPKRRAGKGLLQTLSRHACLVVTDEFPCFFIPHMVASASQKVSVLMESIDSNGILPMKVADKVFVTAYAFRRFLQKKLPDHLFEMPDTESLKGLRLPGIENFPEKVKDRWPPATQDVLKDYLKTPSLLPIDHHVTKVDQQGGHVKARRILQVFLDERLSQYAEKRNEPEKQGTSDLSPYIHFGHISVHEIFQKVMDSEGWFMDRISGRATGSKQGWWGASTSAEAFLDQLITWRELGLNMCWQKNDYDRYESLPDWALSTLQAHEMDQREYVYDLKELESGRTHDPLWNAAQMQLVREGAIHNYLRMLWGKKILEWSISPRIALDTMIELNNKYALDGRDPNSYSGIFWILGRYDRPWGPERPVFGKIRYMSSKNTARKYKVKDYIKKYSGLSPAITAPVKPET